jgi:hypothetical protein
MNYETLETATFRGYLSINFFNGLKRWLIAEKTIENVQQEEVRL